MKRTRGSEDGGRTAERTFSGPMEPQPMHTATRGARPEAAVQPAPPASIAPASAIGPAPEAVATASDTATLAELTVQRVVQATAQLELSGQGEIELDLEPPSLGRVRVALNLGEGTAVVTIQTETAETAQALRQTISRVESALYAQGLRVANFEVQAIADRVAALPAAEALAGQMGRATAGGPRRSRGGSAPERRAPRGARRV